MYFCDNYLLAVVFCVVTMFCWGSWGNTQKLAGKTWRYELFYWDYVIGVLIFALVSGLTAGSFGANPAWGFCTNLRQASLGNLGSAFLGGIVFNAANILLAAAISIAGMSVAFPVGIGLALVLGVVVNYVGAPKGDAALLFGGVGLIVIAILCNAFAYKIKQAANRSAGEPTNRNLFKGLVLSAVCGVLMAFFYRFIACTMDMDFAKPAPTAGMMTPYSAFFVFALGIFVSNFVFNAIAMRHPVSGTPITEREYFRGGFGIHLVGVFGGLVWGLGNGINLVAAGTAGAAISYGLGQGATLVSALWGILIWKEFRGAPRRAAWLNVAMFVLFILGLGLIIRAGEDSPRREPVKVIFDTDMITDFDDVGALACLHALADEGKCEILATVSCTRGNASVAAIEVINAYYGRADLPVGCAKEIGVIGASDKAKTKVDPKSPLTGFKGADGWHYRYRKLAADYPQWVRHLDSDDAPDANEVYRSVLAAQPDHSVVICSVGFLTNLRRLLETKPDRHSPLDGRALVAQKVKGWVAMGFAYPRGAEYNTKGDAESTKIVMDNWPTPAVFSDWTYGGDLFAGRAVAEMAGPRNPVKDVFSGSIPSREEVLADPLGWYKKCFGLGGRAAWDETTVLAAVLGTDDLFNVEYGTFVIDAKTGHNEWVPDYLRKGNRMRVTEKVPKAEVGRLIDELICSSPSLHLQPSPSLSPSSHPSTSVTILDQPGWCNWCPSPAYLPDGRVALAFSRWPTKDGFEAWCAKSEIALAISKKGPLGPYEFVKTILPGSGRAGDFDRDVTHNPFLFVDGGKYYIYYMGTWSDGGSASSSSAEPGSFRMNQRIGVAWAESIEGPYHRSGRQLFADDAIPGMNMNSNPTVIRRPDGRYLMVFKWGENPALPWPRCFVHMASAVADSPLGPWKVVNRDVFPVRYVNFAGEDPYLWLEGRTICCAIHDMGRFYTWDDRALVKFESSDGIDWKNCGVLLSRGAVSRLERPAILCGADGSRLLFAASKPSADSPNSLIVAYPGAMP